MVLRVTLDQIQMNESLLVRSVDIVDHLFQIVDIACQKENDIAGRRDRVVNILWIPDGGDNGILLK